MSQYTEPHIPQTAGTSAQSSATDVVRDEAAQIGQHAREAGGRMAQTTADQARHVVGETSTQARGLLSEAQGQARSQASAQQQKAAQQLHSVADEIGQMAAGGGQSGPATEFARQASERLHGAGSWLEQREPADLLQAARNFASRRPGAFLIGAAVAGLVAGRMTRGLSAQSNQRSTEPEGRAVPAAGPDGVAGSTDPAYSLPRQRTVPSSEDSSWR